MRAEERARITTGWVAAERVRFERRIVTETRQVELTVRREELVVHRSALPDAAAGQPPAQAAPAGQPLVIVLREEVPVVQLAVQPYDGSPPSWSRSAGSRPQRRTAQRARADRDRPGRRSPAAGAELTATDCEATAAT